MSARSHRDSEASTSLWLEGFERLLKIAARSRHYSPALEPLLRESYFRIQEIPPELPAVKASLEALMDFLASPEGRKDVNCCTVDYFFCDPQQWEVGWQHLPEDYRAFLDSIGGALHDAIYAPKIASNFESLPEQLLARVRALG